MAELSFSSMAFHDGEPIPVQFTCDGENRSPDLQWHSIPETAKSLALIVDDPDAPSGLFVHWVIYNMPVSARALPEGVSKDKQVPGIGTQGINSFHRAGYDGPCPPRGKPHRYFFKLYALNKELNLPAGLSASKLEKEIQKHILAQAQMFGSYSRK